MFEKNGSIEVVPKSIKWKIEFKCMRLMAKKTAQRKIIVQNGQKKFPVTHWLTLPSSHVLFCDTVAPQGPHPLKSVTVLFKWFLTSS